MKQTVLITGASTGIGYQLSWLFSRDQYELVLVARSEDKLRELADALGEKHSARIRVISMDLSEAGAAARLLERLSSDGVTIDVLVNNAGFGFHGFFWKIPLEKQQQMMRLNMVTLTELTYLLLPGMIERKRGRILNLASTAAFQPGPLMSVYFATKAFVLSFSEALDNELRGTGVSVTALCPGPTATEFVKTANLTGLPLLSDGIMMSAKAVAEKGYKAMNRGKTLVVPGFLNKLTAFSARIAPRKLTPAIVRKIYEKR